MPLNSPTIENICISVIDDDQMMLQQMEIVLKQVGVKLPNLIVGGANIFEGLSKILQSDILFIDINMPEIDGIEVLRKLAENSFQGSVIIFSGETQDLLKTTQLLAKAHKLNVLGSITKPATKSSIEDYIKKSLQLKNQNNIAGTIDFSVADLKQAIELKKITPFFQPKVCAETLVINSFEVLSRWVKSNGDIIPPVRFIPVAESANLIEALTYSVFEQTLQFYNKHNSLLNKLGFSINLSSSSLTDVLLPERLLTLTTQYNVHPKCITLEITESSVVHSFAKSLDVLTRLRLKGFKLSIDDFGTGFSSMGQLNKIPFNELKIDKEFIQGAIKNTSSLAIVESSAELAKKLNLEIVAEGVETQTELNIAQKCGCDLIQGYFFSKPLSANDFLNKIIESKNARKQLNN